MWAITIDSDTQLEGYHTQPCPIGRPYIVVPTLTSIAKLPAIPEQAESPSNGCLPFASDILHQCLVIVGALNCLQAGPAIAQLPRSRCRFFRVFVSLRSSAYCPALAGHLLIQRILQLLDYRGRMQYESIDKVATVARSRSVLAADPGDYFVGD